jgi:hypothetical protein
VYLIESFLRLKFHELRTKNREKMPCKEYLYVIKLLVVMLLFKQQGSDGIKHAEVLKFMMESGYMPDKPIKTKRSKE